MNGAEVRGKGTTVFIKASRYVRRDEANAQVRDTRTLARSHARAPLAPPLPMEEGGETWVRSRNYDQMRPRRESVVLPRVRHRTSGGVYIYL